MIKQSYRSIDIAHILYFGKRGFIGIITQTGWVTGFFGTDRQTDLRIDIEIFS